MIQTIGSWLITILVIIAPSAVMFARGYTNDSSAMILLAVLWLVVSTIGSFVVKVWHRLEEPAADKVAAEISRRVAEFFGKYRPKYLQHLTYRHRAFDVKGLSTQGVYTLELNQVFVELSIAPQAPHKASADPLHSLRSLPEHLHKGSHDIWEYMRAGPLSSQNLAVIGPPGSGKTTLLKHVTLILAATKPQRREANAPDKLPILLFLRNHAPAITDDDTYGLTEAVQQTLQKWDMAAPPGWFERQLKAGRCLVMLDGLDEVADLNTRQKVVAWVERQMETYGGNRFIITSRPHGYRSNPLRSVTVLEVQPFSQGQMQRFVQNWYRANEVMSAQKDDPGVQMAAREGAEDLLRRLHGAPSLMAMAVNPLLLTMIATVHRYRSSLPGRRVELYAEICEVFLGKRQQAKGLELDLTPAQKQRVLQPLAWFMMNNELREIEREQAEAVLADPLQLVSPNHHPVDFLPMIEQSSGLLLERESGRYSFAHLTFQEYLAAVHAQEQGLEAELTGYVTESWWHETLRLYSARADATPVLQACLAGEPPSIAALTLALECLEEAREVDATVRAELEAVLESWVEDENPELRRLAAETLLALRLRRLRRLDDDTYLDDSLLTQAEYQLFLDDMRERGKYYQPDHWTTLHFPKGQGKTPVAGVRPDDAVAFCAWLTTREKSKWCYRLPQPGEAGDNIGDGYVGYWTEPGDGGSVLAGVLAPAKTKEIVASRVDLDLDHALTRAIDLARTRAIDLDLDLILDHDLTRAIDLTRTIDLPSLHRPRYDLARTFDRALDLARALDLNFALAIGFNRAIDLARTLNLARALDLILDRNPKVLIQITQQLNVDWLEGAAFLRWYIRLQALLTAVALEAAMPAEPWFLSRLSGNNQIQAEREIIQESIDAYLDLYVDFAILEARVEGNLPAFEGIRIVKERVREQTD